ncbi:MAG: hypothetical protein HY868_15830 [Chloroflexi bacterium]|nr:hypothetical protein [Chloroflexota bacterium]
MAIASPFRKMNHTSRNTQYATRNTQHALVLVCYLALALVMTYPLVTQFGDHVPGTTTWSMDEYGYVWNNWWFKHAVFDRAQNPFETNFILYPIGASLVLYAFTLLHVLVGLPIQFAFGLIPASNAELLFSFVVGGYGMFLLSRYLLRTTRITNYQLPISHYAAFIAGALFAFSSNRFVYASLGHYNVVATEWIPFYILFLIKTVREPRWKNAWLAGLFAAFALYVETTTGVLMLLFTLLYLLVAGRAAWQRATLARLAVLGATATVLFAPLLVPTINEIVNSTYALPGWGHAEKLLVDLLGFFSPTSLHPLNRGWVQELDHVRQGNARFVDVNTAFLGYATLALALVAALRFWKTLRVWAISALAFAILSLGPLLNIAGQSRFNFDGLDVTFPMPFLLLHYIPIIKENRVPNRFSILVMLSLAILVAFAVAWILARVSSSKFQVTRWRLLAVRCLLLTVLLFEHSAIPLPLTDARVPEVYAQIAREPGDFAVLTLPLGWRNSFGQLGAEDARVQYYQNAHRKFIFPANIQRNPPYLFEYFDRAPIFHSLTEIEFYREVLPETRARDKAIAPALMAFFDVRYVVIHPAIPGRPPYSDTRGAVVEYIENVLPLGEKIFERDGVLAYRVKQAALPARQEIRFGADAAQLYQAEGWDRDEVLAGEPANWATQRQARVVFPLREVSDYQLTVRALPFATAQTMELVINDQPIQKFGMRTGWENYTVTLPARALHSGVNTLALRFANLARPRDVTPPNFAIGATGVTSPVEIVARAEERASIRVNGKEIAPQKTGYNVVVLDPRTGAVDDARAFDTINDRVGSRAFTDFIAQIPNGQIVAVVSQDAVAANLGDRAAAAFQLIGGQVDIRANPTRTHALIGVKGAPPGSALEQSQDGASFVSVGRNPDTRTLAAAVSVMVIEKK